MALCVCTERAELPRWAGGWRKVGAGAKVASGVEMEGADPGLTGPV